MWLYWTSVSCLRQKRAPPKNRKTKTPQISFTIFCRLGRYPDFPPPVRGPERDKLWCVNVCDKELRFFLNTPVSEHIEKHVSWLSSLRITDKDKDNIDCVYLQTAKTMLQLKT